MDEELTGKIKEIGGLLGIQDIPDNIGDVLGAFLGSNNSSEKKSTENEVEENKSLPSLPEKKETEDLLQGLDPIMLMNLLSRVKSIQEKNANDEKVRLLKALRPFLSGDRRKKVDNCVSLLALKEFAPLLSNFGK